MSSSYSPVHWLWCSGCNVTGCNMSWLLAFLSNLCFSFQLEVAAKSGNWSLTDYHPYQPLVKLVGVAVNCLGLDGAIGEHEWMRVYFLLQSSQRIGKVWCKIDLICASMTYSIVRPFHIQSWHTVISWAPSWPQRLNSTSSFETTLCSSMCPYGAGATWFQARKTSCWWPWTSDYTSTTKDPPRIIHHNLAHMHIIYTTRL